MKRELEIPDSIYKDDPVGYGRFLDALQLMLNRMAMSHSKYQAKTYPPTMEFASANYDEMKSIQQRLAMYDPSPLQKLASMKYVAEGLELLKPMDTGNTENLLDAANMCLVEFLFPKHPKAHFCSQRSDESPNLAYKE